MQVWKPVAVVVGGIVLIKVMNNKAIRNYLVEVVIDAGAELVKMKLKKS